MANGSMFLLLCLATLMSDKIEGSKLLKSLRKTKGMTWEAGDNSRFRGLTFRDAQLISGNVHKLRPDTIPLAVPPNLTVSIPLHYNFTDRFPMCEFGPLDQGRCGSCWAFSIAKSFSHRYCRKHGDLRVFSPGHLAGCDRRNMGCDGGILVPGWRYIDLRGLPLHSCVPYDINATTINCSRKCAEQSQLFETNKTEFWSVGRYASIEEIQIGIMFDGPVTTSMKVFTDFLYYKKGIYTQVKGTLIGFHAVEIIGWGTEKGVDYWEVSNSWGTKWGVGGKFFIQRGINECGIEDYVAAGRPI
jgi:C1A family cysteine protease